MHRASGSPDRAQARPESPLRARNAIERNTRVCPDISRTGRRRAAARAEPVALARQVDPRHSAHRLPRVPVAGVHGADGRRVRRRLRDRPVPEVALRVQRRCAPLDVARGVLHARSVRDGSLPAVHPCRRPRLSRSTRDRLSRASRSRLPAARPVAARDTPLHHRRRVRRWVVGGVARWSGNVQLSRTDRLPGRDRRARPAVHRGATRARCSTS